MEKSNARHSQVYVSGDGKFRTTTIPAEKNSHLKITVVFLIALLGTGQLYILLQVVQAIGTAISLWLEIILYTGWMMICFTCFLWVPYFFSGDLPVRKMVAEEEEWISPLLYQINHLTGLKQTPVLLILEDPRPDIFVTGWKTIVISRGLVVLLSESQLAALLAHAYAHIKSRDIVEGNAFYLVNRVAIWLHHLLSLFFSINLARLLLTATFIYMLFFNVGIAAIIAGSFIFAKSFPLLNELTGLLWGSYERKLKFSHDRFVDSIGYGSSLKEALQLTGMVNTAFTIEPIALLYYSPPLLTERIKRLEWLELLRS